MIKHYFNLHFHLINRKLKESGFNPLFAYSFGCTVFLTLSYFLFSQSEYARYVYLLPLLFILNLLSNKKRNDFLKSTFKTKDYKTIRLTENALVAVPFVIVSLFFKEFYFPIIALLLSFLLSFVVVNSQNSFAFPTPFSKHPFEFNIGFRKSILFIIGTYIVLIFGIYVGNFALAIFSIPLTFLIILSYIAVLENVFFVWIYNKTAAQFLNYKMKMVFFYSLILILPQSITLAWFFPSNSLIIIAVTSLLLCTACLSVLVKYSVFPTEINIPEVLLIIASIIFPPLLILTFPYFYLKAKTNLNSLFHDTN